MAAVPRKIVECVWLSVVYWWRLLDTPLREFICTDILGTNFFMATFHKGIGIAVHADGHPTC